MLLFFMYSKGAFFGYLITTNGISIVENLYPLMPTWFTS